MVFRASSWRKRCIQESLPISLTKALTKEFQNLINVGGVEGHFTQHLLEADRSGKSIYSMIRLERRYAFQHSQRPNHPLHELAHHEQAFHGPLQQQAQRGLMVNLAERTTAQSEGRSLTTEQIADLIRATPQELMVLELAWNWINIPWRQQQEAVFVLAEALALHGKTAVDLDRHVGARIRERRWMLGLTMEQLAELTGVSDSQVWKYETGVSRIAPGRLYQIALALGVDIMVSALHDRAEVFPGLP